MKKIIAILMCLLCFGFMVACSKNDSVKDGTYIVKGEENLTDPAKQLNKTRICIEKGRCTIIANPLYDCVIGGQYEIKDGKIYVSDEDNNKFVFKISGKNLIFEEGPMLEKHEKKGTEFVITDEWNMY